MGGIIRRLMRNPEQRLNHSNERPVIATELQSGDRVDLHAANPDLKSLAQLRQEAESAAAAAYLAAEVSSKPELSPQETVRSLANGIVRLRIIKQQRTPASHAANVPWNSFEVTK